MPRGGGCGRGDQLPAEVFGEGTAAGHGAGGGAGRVPDSRQRGRSVGRGPSDRGALELLEVLSEREREMLRLFLGGMTYEQIGEVRNVRAVTVRNAVSGAQRKLGFKTRQQMVVWAVRAGLVDGGSGVS